MMQEVYYRGEYYTAVPPGNYIIEQLEHRHMPESEFAHRIGISKENLIQLLKGLSPITADLARRIESVLHMEANFWLSLEKAYQDDLAKIDREKEILPELHIAESMPYDQMAEWGWVPDTFDILEQVDHLRTWFMVDNLEVLKNRDTLENLVGLDRVKQDGINYSLVAWAQYAKIKSREKEVKTFNMTQLTNKLTKIKALIGEDPTIYLPKLAELLAKAGVALVLLPPIDDSQTLGFTFKEKGRVVIALPAIGRSDAYFWKAFLREIYCITVGAIYTDKIPTVKDEDIHLFIEEYPVPEGKYTIVD